jgi:hypothetical protein
MKKIRLAVRFSIFAMPAGAQSPKNTDMKCYIKKVEAFCPRKNVSRPLFNGVLGTTPQSEIDALFAAHSARVDEFDKQYVGLAPSTANRGGAGNVFFDRSCYDALDWKHMALECKKN